MSKTQHDDWRAVTPKQALDCECVHYPDKALQTGAPTCSEEDDGGLGGSDSTEGTATLGVAVHLGDDDCTNLGGAKQRHRSWMLDTLAKQQITGHRNAQAKLHPGKPRVSRGVAA